MSFWGGNDEGPSPMTVAKAEAEIMTDMFNKMVTSCHKKCVVKHNESDLQVGEMACIDRCVGKYNQTQELVGAMLYKFEQDQQAKEKAAGGKPK